MDLDEHQTRTHVFEHADLVAHALCYLEARWAWSFGCCAQWAAELFRSERTFRHYWQESVASGDRVDAMDVEGRWFEADVIAATAKSVTLHYRSWNSSFDQKIQRSSPRLAPLFTHCADWRPALARGQLIEAKKDKAWYLAVVLRVVRSGGSGAPRWSRLDAAVVKSSRDNDCLRVLSPGFASPRGGTAAAADDDLHTWHLTDFDSEDIAPLGTHIRPGQLGKHYTTNSIVMPMSFLIDIMSRNNHAHA